MTQETLTISTGYSVTKDFWDEKKREIKKGYKGYGSISRINNLLNSKRIEARQVITELEEKGKLSSLSTLEVKSRIVSRFREPEAANTIVKLRNKGLIASEKKKETVLNHLNDLVTSGELAQIPMKDYESHFAALASSGSVLKFIYEIEQNLIDIKKVGNASIYRDLGGVLKNYAGSRASELTFNDINLKFVEGMEKWHLKKGLKINGLSVYLRTLRATYNKAVKAGLADRDASPFIDYKIKSERTAKRAISKEYLLRIVNLKLDPKDELFDARNFFLASYAMQGMSFIDMSFLKVSDVFDGRIKYQRSKTSRHYNILCTDMVRGIIDHYSEGKSPNEFIFPIIKRLDIAEQYLDAKWARKRYNRKLKLVAEKCEIKENLTSYVSRHSFAMSARLANVPIDAISQMLGHRAIKTTEIYLDNIPDKTIDDYMGTITNL